jgi:hypothetical protein
VFGTGAKGRTGRNGQSARRERTADLPWPRLIWFLYVLYVLDPCSGKVAHEKIAIGNFAETGLQNVQNVQNRYSLAGRPVPKSDPLELPAATGLPTWGGGAMFGAGAKRYR